MQPSLQIKKIYTNETFISMPVTYSNIYAYDRFITNKKKYIPMNII